MQPKLKDVHKIADAIALQVTTPQSQTGSLSPDGSLSGSLRSTSVPSHGPKQARMKQRAKRNRSSQNTDCSPKRNNHFGRAYSSTSLSRVPDTQDMDQKRRSIQDLYTDTDKFSYDTDLTTLTANIDIENLTSNDAISLAEIDTAPQVDIDYENDDIIASSLLDDSESVTSAVEVNNRTTSALTITSNSTVNSDDFGSSLFDDPDLLTDLPPVATCGTVKANNNTVSTEENRGSRNSSVVGNAPLMNRNSNASNSVTSPRIVVTNEDNELKDVVASNFNHNSSIVQSNTDTKENKEETNSKEKKEETNSKPNKEEVGHIVSTFEGLKSIDTTPLTKEEIDRYKEELQQKKLVSTFGGLKSIDSLNSSELETHKAEILHRKLVSESEYGSLILKAQERTSTDKVEPLHLNEISHTKINAIKDRFNGQSATEFLFMRNTHNSNTPVTLTHHDLKADIEHQKDADVISRQELQNKLQEAALVSNFRGFETTNAMRATISAKEQEQTAESGKVTQFKGLQSTAKTVRTAEIDENLLASKLVSGSAYEEALKKQKDIPEVKKSKEINIDTTHISEAKNIFQQMEKETTAQTTNNLKPSAAKRKKKSKKISTSTPTADNEKT